MTKGFDILIQKGNLVDGTGAKLYSGDIAVEKGRIVRIDSKVDADASTTIDADGLIISPGFIDMHSHSDTALPFDNRLESTIRQGITTSVIGSCGFSLAPVNEEQIELIRKEFDIFSPPGASFEISWRSFHDYLLEIEKGGISSNIIPLVGFGAIRIAGGPAYEDRAPTVEELGEMQKYTLEAMESGAFGMSTGLIYPPQVYASTEEIIEVAKIVGEHGGLYFSHIRGEGATVVKAVQEVIDIVEKSGCSGGQIAHHKVAGKAFWGMSKDTLKLIADANARGISVTCDQYPYNRGSTSLISLLPPWVHVGGIDELLQRISEAENQKRIRMEIEKEEDWENMVEESGWEKIFISSVKTEKWKDTEGLSITEIARARDYEDEFAVLFEILLDERAEVMMTMESMGQEDIERIMKSQYTMIGTDGSGVSPTGILSHGKPHPRHYGTYPRVLGRYVRERGFLSLEEAIHKMTGFPAKRLGFTDRGILQEGSWADIVIFDPDTIIDNATFLDPHQFPTGIHHVIVNGTIVVTKDVQLDLLPGKV
ncbi:MAG: N-acyl-D-amino-acid deacylase family protein, partial [Candidatus Thorarchaeota archaeon]